MSKRKMTPTDILIKRKKSSWVKLTADNKTLHVFAKSRVPRSIERLKYLVGIGLVSATKEERKPYLKIEALR